LFDSQTKSREEKKRKIVKTKRKKQKETKEKAETVRNKKQINHAAIKVIKRSLPDLKVTHF
jgi:hypothetical protein